MPHQNPIRRFSLALSLFAVQLIVFTSTVVTADQLIILRSGNRSPEPEPTLTTLPPDDPSSEVAGGTSCTVVEDCPLLTQLDLDNCKIRTCDAGTCSTETSCTVSQSCNGAGTCVEIFPLDTLLTFLPGPENGPFVDAFTQQDFDDARAGLSPRIGIPENDTSCISAISENPMAEVVLTDHFLLSRPSTTALYAIDFEITAPAVLAASIDLYIRANDTLGSAVNQGIFINGVALSGDTTGGNCSGDVFHIYRDDIAPLLHVGTNTIYFNVTHTNLDSGMIFSAELRIDSDGPTIIHVMDGAAPGGDGSTWETAFSTIGEGLVTADASADPDRQIWVAAGTYLPTPPLAGDPRAATFTLIKDLVIYGGFAGTETDPDDRNTSVNVTTITGDLDGNDMFDSSNPTWNENAYHLFSTPSPATNIVLDGLTITHGKANGVNATEDRGAGLFVSSSAEVKFVDCRIVENYAERFGTISMRRGGKAEFIDCEISDHNTGAGWGVIFGEFGVEVTLAGTTFARNNSSGGAAITLFHGGSITATDCLFEENIALGTGGAIYTFSTDPFDPDDVDIGIDISLTRCTFARNEASNGGAIYTLTDRINNSGSLIINDCVFEENILRNLGRGGAIYATKPETLNQMDVWISDTTFTGNYGGSSGGAIHSFGAVDLRVLNCSFNDNLARRGGAINNSTDSLIVENCLFDRNRATDWGGAISQSSGDNVRITGSTFLYNTARQSAGACSLGGLSTLLVTVERCLFLGNSARGDGGGLYLFAPETDVRDCLFVGNHAEQIGGGGRVDDGELTFTNCSFYGNIAGQEGGGIYGKNSYIKFRNSILRQNTDANGGGFTAQAFSDPTTFVEPRYSNIEGVALVDGNIDEDPVFTELPNDGGDGWGNENDNFGDLHLLPGSPSIDSADNSAVAPESTTDLDGAPRFHDDTGTPDAGNGTPPIVDMGCYEFQGHTPQIHHVDDDAPLGGDGSNWAAAFRYLQDGLVTADVGDTILVAQGTYRPDQGDSQISGSREATFQLVEGTEIRGGYAGIGADDPDARDINGFETVLSGDIGVNQDVSDNSFHVIVASGTSPATVLDGLTISGGYANGVAPTTDNGGGFYSDGGSPMLNDCTLENNYASADGGGAYVTSGAPSFEHCTFVRNSAGSAGGGMANISVAHTQLNSCRFFSNSSVSGGGAIQNQSSSFAIIRNSLFVGNSTGGDGGAINSISSTPIITNNVVVQNEAGGVGGGIAYNQATFLIMASTIVWNNVDNTAGTTTDQISVTGATFIASTNCVQNFSLAGIAGNISEDPMLLRRPYDGGDGWGDLNDDFGDLHLLPGSPCIDAGNNAVLPESVVDDHDGNPRFHDDPTTVDTGPGDAQIVDMGAFEFRPADCDHSGDTGLIDLADLLPCLLGPETEVSPECACFDLNNDGLVNLRDVALFQEVYGLP